MYKLNPNMIAKNLCKKTYKFCGSLEFSNSKTLKNIRSTLDSFQPTREECSQCSKGGLGKWCNGNKGVREVFIGFQEGRGMLVFDDEESR